MLLVFVIAFVLALLPGCGGDEEPAPKTEIADKVNAWYDALAAGDGDSACGLMTEKGRASMTTPYKGIGPDRPPLAATCEAAVAKTADEGDENGIPEVSADDVRIWDEFAATQDSAGMCTYLQTEEDEWLVAALPIPIGREPDPVTGEVRPCDLDPHEGE